MSHKRMGPAIGFGGGVVGVKLFYPREGDLKPKPGEYLVTDVAANSSAWPSDFNAGHPSAHPVPEIRAAFFRDKDKKDSSAISTYQKVISEELRVHLAGRYFQGGCQDFLPRLGPHTKGHRVERAVQCGPVNTGHRATLNPSLRRWFFPVPVVDAGSARGP
jgi:hypothetical protein